MKKAIYSISLLLFFTLGKTFGQSQPVQPEVSFQNCRSTINSSIQAQTKVNATQVNDTIHPGNITFNSNRVQMSNNRTMAVIAPVENVNNAENVNGMDSAQSIKPIYKFNRIKISNKEPSLQMNTAH